jgi:hypothetical protein
MFGCAAFSPAIDGTAGHAPNLDLSPESLGRSLSLSQIVTGTYGDQTQSMRFEIEIEGNMLVIAALSHLGATLFVLRQEGDKIVVDAYAGELNGIDPSWMLFDLQVTYWPGEGLERALSMQRMRLEDEPKNSVRRVFGPEGELVMEVRYLDGFLAPGDISIDHFDRPYRLLINTLEPGKNS